MPTIDTDTAEGKAELQKLIDEATKGLKEKRDELLANDKKRKDELKSLQDRLEALEAEKADAEQKAAEKGGDIEKIKSQLEAKHKKELDTVNAKLEAANSKLHTTLVDGGITEALTKAGVAPQYLDASKALLLKNKAEIEENENGVVVKIDGKPLNEFVTAWAQGDQGKHFVAAPNNGGGGAQGADGKSKAPTDKKKAEYTFTEKSEFIQKNGLDAWNQLKD
jgi:SMC interacting uncharacterized protein involved in chromosome segregation